MRPVKLLFLAAMLALLVCATGCEEAEPGRIEQLRADNGAYVPGGVLSSYCFEGYRYLVYHAVGLSQMWEDGPNGPRPMRCGQSPETPIP